MNIKIVYTFLIGLLFLSAKSFTEDNNLKNDESYNFVDVTGLNDSTTYRFVTHPQLYTEGWDTLAQPKFWKTLITMSSDSALINIGSDRTIIQKIALKDWNKMSNEQQNNLRDSVKCHYNLSDDDHIYLTSGKKDFYNFDKVIPSINRGIEVFTENKVDPFYAQAILLIESPNKLQKSSVGAYGSFQIMKKVAIKMGLKVNKYVDERKDFDKSAYAAAKLLQTICIPETNKMLLEKGINFNPSDLWYRLLVLHVYHAGAGNVKKAIDFLNPTEGNMQIITQLWQTEIGNFRNSSQNYSQLVLATMLQLDEIIYNKGNIVSYYNNNLN